MRARWDLAAVRRIRRVIRTWRPRVVHVHDPRALSLAQTALAGLDEILLVFTCRSVPERGSLMRRTGRSPDIFVAPNLDTSRFLAAAGAEESRTVIIRPAARIAGEVKARDWRRECRWAAETIVCGASGLGASTSRHNIREVVLHIPQPLRSLLRIVVLGGEPGGETRIGSVPVFGAGFVDELAPAIAGLDFLLNFSGADSMNTAVLEAMALGVPPVAYRAGGCGEYIEHLRSGLVVDESDPVAFAAAVSSLLENRELHRTLAAFARRRAAEFSVERMGEATNAAYTEAQRMRRSGDQNRGRSWG
jgi:glycosyltransferase involved in cell wall biosynthesis